MLYDFEGDVPSGELVVYDGEILTVSRTVSVVICTQLTLFLFGLALLLLVCNSCAIVLDRMSAMAGGKGLAQMVLKACFLKLTLR